MFPNRFVVDKLAVEVYNSRTELGVAAARQVAGKIQELQRSQQQVNMIFAAAPSQNEFLEELKVAPGITWNRINAFHMDEYIGLDADVPQSFGKFLKTRLFDLMPFKTLNYISPSEPVEECARYTQLLNDFPPDIVCLGIGENGHLAFNDPPVADFSDPELVKIVKLDFACQQQQVNDGCFETLELVPKTAITLTIPALLAAKHICCVVPGNTKANAVKHTLYEHISTSCPSSILRTHPDATLYLDSDSFGM